MATAPPPVALAGHKHPAKQGPARRETEFFFRFDCHLRATFAA
jgi:hypothetical protein